ncbi:nuclear transport factor 2 family protein [Gordonia sp. i37]|uniref:nuclear transport factor 2 family protein n=1 Tax=Gordonia sp. i37 TaxID=1961707 RepID=UPI0009AE2A53|nr:nuclear transport factor 2 family protein [Gordonia sp. i37]OPX06666.1 hypothetical protein B1964_28425 [Gordonia sp. i37]
MSDQEELIALSARFADAVTRVDVDAFADVWSDSGVWVIAPPLDVTMTGSGAELAAGFAAGAEAMWATFIQQVHQVLVEVDSDSATGRTYITELGYRHDGTGQTLHGVYDDEYVRTATGWKFAKRHFSYLYYDPATQFAGQFFVNGKQVASPQGS